MSSENVALLTIAIALVVLNAVTTRFSASIAAFFARHTRRSLRH